MVHPPYTQQCRNFRGFSQAYDCLFRFFNNEDGTYDGWGGGMSCLSGQSKEIIQAQEDALRYISAGGRVS